MEEAAGSLPLSTVPLGAITLMGRNMPAVFGMSSRITARTQRYTTDDVKDSVQFSDPRTCGADPVKSTVR